MYIDKLGIIGGFGAYATLGFYHKILEAFASENERNYPHIIIDNNFTMPSRTRALLYGESYDEIVVQIAESMKLLIAGGARWIILVCGTAHFFLQDVYCLLPEAQKKVIDIIDICGEYLRRGGGESVLIIAAEGALLKELYPRRLLKYEIFCINPGKEYYKEIRFFIESVKRNNLNQSVTVRFIDFLRRFQSKNVVLGCTEFSVLAKYISDSKLTERQRKEWNQYVFYDPLEIAIKRLKTIMN